MLCYQFNPLFNNFLLYEFHGYIFPSLSLRCVFSWLVCCSHFSNSVSLWIIRELRIGIVPYSPIGRGFLAGKAVVESLPQSSFLVGIDFKVGFL